MASWPDSLAYASGSPGFVGVSHTHGRTNMSKTALVTGVTGQDGSYLAEFLLDRGYEVHGTCRRTSTDVLERIGHLEGRLHLHQADLHDQSSLSALLRKI